MRERDFNKYERMWKKMIRWCELADQKFREKEWDRIWILIGFKEWPKKLGF